MATRISSFKKLEALHRDLGGKRKHYYLTRFGSDIDTGKQIREDSIIAWHSKPSANWATKLVKGTIRKPLKR